MAQVRPHTSAAIGPSICPLSPVHLCFRILSGLDEWPHATLEGLQEHYSEVSSATCRKFPVITDLDFRSLASECALACRPMPYFFCFWFSFLKYS